MIHAPEETDEFTALADALVINVGTLSAHAAESMERAAGAARMHGKPWLLDPVAAASSPFATRRSGACFGTGPRSFAATRPRSWRWRASRA